MEVGAGVAPPQVRRPGIDGPHVDAQYGHREVHVLRTGHRPADRRQGTKGAGTLHLRARQVDRRRPHQLCAPVVPTGDRRTDDQQSGQQHHGNHGRGGPHAGTYRGQNQAHHGRQRQHPEGPPGHGVGFAGGIKHVEHPGGQKGPEDHHRAGQQHQTRTPGAHHSPGGQRCAEGQERRKAVAEHHSQHGHRLGTAVEQAAHVEEGEGGTDVAEALRIGGQGVHAGQQRRRHGGRRPDETAELIAVPGGGPDRGQHDRRGDQHRRRGESQAGHHTGGHHPQVTASPTAPVGRPVVPEGGDDEQQEDRLALPRPAGKEVAERTVDGAVQHQKGRTGPRGGRRGPRTQTP